MKYSEMNQKQQKAFRNIKYAANDLIGGLENGCLDSPEGSQQWNDYNSALQDHDYLVSEIYQMAITGIYEEGASTNNSFSERYMKDIRFCGKAWLMERVEARVRKLGY